MSGIGVNSNLGQNLIWILENQIRRDVIPLGVKNNVNLTYTFPGVERATPGTLEVWLSCIKLQTDSYILAPDMRSFTIVLDAENPWKLNCPPQQDEPLFVNYLLFEE